MKARKFIDSAVVHVSGGDGGNGCCSFRREKYVPKGGPDGGDGGRGGDVIIRADADTDSLIHCFFSPNQQADRGTHGKGKKMHGKNGADLFIPVPCGTEVWDAATNTLLGDMIAHDSELLVARGGKGGLGNVHWLTPTHQAPREHTEGEEGEKRTLRLELKIAADFGLVGFPNAGKSSLLRQLTNARPKVAAYPFTTISPVIGTIVFEDYTSATIADIPGIIKGAHKGLGLGDRFLRHIERSAALLYVIDMSGSEGREPWSDYRALQTELGLYRKELRQRTSLVVANKMDLPESEANRLEFVRETGINPVAVSSVTASGIDVLRRELWKRSRWEA